jgi:glycosyltransferase involved in cell wall biosynthesis
VRISIVTPSYNQAQFVERTVRSVLEQTGNFDLEYIIVDGGSTDGSKNIIERYAAADQRIRFIYETDKGQSDAINKGLRLTTGDIVAFLNSDDIYYPGTLQAVATAFQAQPQRDWLYSCCRIIDEHDREIRRLITLYKNILGCHYSYNKLLMVNFISQPATFWRRSCLETVGIFDEGEHLVMDYDYWCRLGKQSQPVRLPQYLAGFRSYKTSKSGQRYLQQFHDELRVTKKYTGSHAVLFIHKLHNWFITTCYRLLS